MNIYEKDNIYYLASNGMYEIAQITLRYNRMKKKNVLTISGTGNYVSGLTDYKVYTFKELEKKLCESEVQNG